MLRPSVLLSRYLEKYSATQPFSANILSRSLLRRTAMEEREEETVFSIWVNWERRVISFTQENGVEELTFPTHEDKFQFAIERGNEGFGIQ